VGEPSMHKPPMNLGPTLNAEKKKIQNELFYILTNIYSSRKEREH
jgi:hypothetical protein